MGNSNIKDSDNVKKQHFVGFNLVGNLMVLLLLGYFIDKIFETKPFAILFFLVIGILFNLKKIMGL